MSWQYLLAWLLPLFAGSGLVLAIGGGRRMPGNLCAMLGTGFLLGVFVAGILCSLIARENVQGAFADVAPGWRRSAFLLGWLPLACAESPGRRHRSTSQGLAGAWSGACCWQ